MNTSLMFELLEVVDEPPTEEELALNIRIQEEMDAAFELVLLGEQS